MQIGIGINISSGGRASGASYSEESLAFFARLATEPTAERKAAYDALIVALVYAGVWAKLDALYVLTAVDAATANTNLISEDFTLVPTGSPAFEADAGYTGTNDNGVHLETGFDPTEGTPNYTRDSASLFAYKNVDNADDGGLFIGRDGAAYLQGYRGDSKFYLAMNGGGGIANAVATNTGLYLGSRPDSTHSVNYLNGTLLVNSEGSNSIAIIAGRTFRFLGSALAGGNSNAQISAGGFGGALTGADSRNLYTAIQGYLSDIADEQFLLGFSSDIVNDGLGNITPGLCRLADGRLLAVWCVGNNQADCKIIGSTSADDGKTWSASFDIALPPADHTYTDTCVTALSDGTIVISFFDMDNDFASSFEAKTIRGTVGVGLAFTWEAPVTITTTIVKSATSSYVVELQNGRLMLGIYDVTTARIRVVFSDDVALTWGDEVEITAAIEVGDSFNEINFVQQSNGTIIGILRNDNFPTPSRTGYWRTASINSGQAWTVPTQVINNVLSNAPSRPAPVLLPDGKIFLLTRFTNSLDDNRTGFTWSTDAGLNWEPIQIYYTVGQYSYGQHISAQGFYDTETESIMYVLVQGSFAVGQVNFQQFALPE
jgi:hypothetical protein